MLNISSYVSVIPRIVRANTETKIKIKPKYSFIEFTGRYRVSVLPKYFFHSSDRVAQYESFTVEASDNCIEIAFCFGNEQEYCIQVTAADGIDENQRPFRHLYTLYPTIYIR